MERRSSYHTTRCSQYLTLALSVHATLASYKETIDCYYTKLVPNSQQRPTSYWVQAEDDDPMVGNPLLDTVLDATKIKHKLSVQEHEITEREKRIREWHKLLSATFQSKLDSDDEESSSSVSRPSYDIEAGLVKVHDYNSSSNNKQSKKPFSILWCCLALILVVLLVMALLAAVAVPLFFYAGFDQPLPHHRNASLLNHSINALTYPPYPSYSVIKLSTPVTTETITPTDMPTTETEYIITNTPTTTETITNTDMPTTETEYVITTNTPTTQSILTPPTTETITTKNNPTPGFIITTNNTESTTNISETITTNFSTTMRPDTAISANATTAKVVLPTKPFKTTTAHPTTTESLLILNYVINTTLSPITTKGPSVQTKQSTEQSSSKTYISTSLAPITETLPPTRKTTNTTINQIPGRGETLYYVNSTRNDNYSSADTIVTSTDSISEEIPLSDDGYETNRTIPMQNVALAINANNTTLSMMDPTQRVTSTASLVQTDGVLDSVNSPIPSAASSNETATMLTETTAD